MGKLERHPDRLFDTDSEILRISRRLYDLVSDLPIISPHGHVEAELLAKNSHFESPSELFVRPDHYLTRVLHSFGVDLASLGVNAPDYDHRHAWAILANNWHLFLGTPTRYWLEDQMSIIFGVNKDLSADTADEIYDQISEHLKGDEFRPRQLLERFGVEYLATTDPAHSDLAWHRELAGNTDFTVRVAPTLRPDALMDPTQPTWRAAVDSLGDRTGTRIASFGDLRRALVKQREFFTRNLATSTDTGIADPRAKRLEADVVEELFARALDGTMSPEQAIDFQAHFLYELISMAAEDGLVMQLHAGVLRNHHLPTLKKSGPDSGHDLPLRTNFTENLRDVLNDFGTGSKLRMVLFSVDASAYALDIAPLAGFYPSLYLGAPWWFLDHPEQINAIRESTTAHVGFYKTSGFIDDTRALCSIPARHDMSRRLDSSFLAKQVATKRISIQHAERVAVDLVTKIPAETFRLEKELSTGHVSVGGEPGGQ